MVWNDETKAGNNSSYNDDAYLKSIEKYKGESWYDRLLENPWLYSKQAPFSPTLGQQFSEFFGDTSARDNYYAGILQNQNQWLSDTLAQYHQQDYDSAIEQKKRLQAAGLNPDLTGGVTAGAAAENDQPMSNVPMPSQSSVSELFGLGSSVLSTAFSVVTGFTGVRSAILDNSLKSLSLNSNLTSQAYDIIKSGISENIASLGDIGNGVSDDSILVKNVAELFSDRIDSLPYSRSNKRKLHQITDSLIFNTSDKYKREFSSSFESLLNEALSSQNVSRNDRAKSRALPGANISWNKALNFVSEKIYKPLNDMALEVENLRLKNEKGYQSNALKLGLGSSRASAEHAGYLVKVDINNVRKKITSSFNRISQSILNSSDLPPMWKLALQAGLYSAEAIAFSKLSVQ